MAAAGAAGAAGPRRAPVQLPAGPPWPELQATPTMGYNGWLAATMGHEPDAKNQSLYYRIADELVASGLAAAGYDTLLTTCIGWQRDPVTRQLEAPAATWPDGFKALVDYAHARGLKVGAYTDTGAVGCCRIGTPPAREIGSLGHEELDIARFAEWGVDHVAVDNCGHPNGTQASVYEYAAIHAALLKVGRPMVYGIWNIGAGGEWKWARKLGHYYRTSTDIGNIWGQDTANSTTDGAQSGHMGVMFNYDVQQSIPSIAALSGPGSFAFMDQLMVGQAPGVPHGAGDVGLSADETRTHFGLWAIMASPLWLTYDIFDKAAANYAAVLALVTNAEAIAINQDARGEMAVRVDGDSRSVAGLLPRLPATCGAANVWPNGEQLARPLANGDFAVLAFNRLAAVNLTITIDFRDIGDTTVTCFAVRDVWARRDLGVVADRFEAGHVPPHGSRFLRLTPAHYTLCDGLPPAPPPPPAGCNVTAPAGFAAYAQRGYWSNHTLSGKAAGLTVASCAASCAAAGASCRAFHVFHPCMPDGACYLYFGGLGAFVPNDSTYAFNRG